MPTSKKRPAAVAAAAGAELEQEVGSGSISSKHCHHRPVGSVPPACAPIRAESGDTRCLCRNQHCRSKLPAPADDDRHAFCCRFCFEQFYRTRCLICEAALPPGPINRKICRRAKCRAARRKNGARWHGDKSAGRLLSDLKKAPATTLAEHAERPLRNPIKSGVKTGLKPCRAPCLIGPGDPPINLLNGFRWSGAAQLEPGRAGKIKLIETEMLQAQHRNGGGP